MNDGLMMDGRNEKGQFIKGRVVSEEERAKKIESLKESWKDRIDYIADIKNECPRIYNSWRAMRFTEKGKKAGNSPEWDDFRNFYNDVRSSWVEGASFRRLDVSKPFSKDNFEWKTKEQKELITQKRENTATIEVDGVVLTLREAAETFNVKYGGLKQRYYANKKSGTYTVEEIIFGKKKKRKDKEVKDYRESSTPVRAKASKMISSYKFTDKKLGFEKICDIDIDWMIENIITKPCIYCGSDKRVGCDRIDNDKGHTKDNVVPCCYDCNCARNNNFSHEEMLILGKTIHEIKENRIQNK